MSNYLIQQLINGLQLGSMYALIALGYTMVYGIIRLINFAHADIFMTGAYLAFYLLAFTAGATAGGNPLVWIWVSLIAGYLLWAWVVAHVAPLGRLHERLHAPSNNSRWHTSFGKTAGGIALGLTGVVLCGAIIWPVCRGVVFGISHLNKGPVLFVAVALFVMLCCGLLGVAMEKIAYRPLRFQPRLSALITALGVSLFLENFASLEIVFGNAYRAFPVIIEKGTLLRIPGAGVSISNLFVLNMTVLAVLLAGLWFLVEKTLSGKQMRAVAFDKKAALLMGIDVDRIIAVTFFIGPALAGVAGLLFAMNYGILQSPFLGFYPGVKAFVAAVLGGVGSLPGAVLGAMILGTTEVFANSVDSNLGFAAAFVILIIILLFMPNGLLGKKESEKV